MLYDFLIPDAIVSFQTVVNYEIVNTDLHSITLKNCTFQSSKIQESNLSSSDFLGSRFAKCRLTDTKFNYADICSFFAEDTVFYNVTFENATIYDCTFIHCTFENCNFNHANMTNTNFQNCCFRKFDLQHSTTSLNKFINTDFINCNIHGNFFYNIMTSCSFTDSSISQTLLGYNFGIYNSSNTKDDINKLVEYFQKNNMFINIAILNINIEESIYDYSLLAGIVSIGKMLQMDMLLRSEEIIFLKMLFDYMSENDLVAPITVIKSWHILINMLKDSKETTAIIKAKDNINLLINSLYQHQQDFLLTTQQLISESNSFIRDHQPLQIKIHYENKPDIPLNTLIEEMQTLCSISAPKPLLLKTETGSFFEWIQSYDSVCAYLQTFLALLGVVFTIWQPWKKHKKTKSGENNNENDEGAQSSQHSNDSLAENVDAYQMFQMINKSSVSQVTEQVVINCITVVNNNNIINNINFSGYNRKNVLNIEVSPNNH